MRTWSNDYSEAEAEVGSYSPLLAKGFDTYDSSFYTDDGLDGGATAEVPTNLKLVLDYRPIRTTISITINSVAASLLEWGQAPGSGGQVAVNYVTGELEFNSTDIGEVVEAVYKHYGTVIDAHAFNRIQKHLVELGAAPPSHVHSAADITSGTLVDDRLSSNVVLENTTNIFTAGQRLSHASPQIEYIDTATANKNWKLVNFGGSFYISETGISDRYKFSPTEFLALANITLSGGTLTVNSSASRSLTTICNSGGVSMAAGGLSAGQRFDILTNSNNANIRIDPHGTGILDVQSAATFAGSVTSTTLRPTATSDHLIADSASTFLDFDFFPAANTTRTFRYGRGVDTGTGSLATIWYKGDGTSTTAMSYDHKTGILFNSGVYTSNSTSGTHSLATNLSISKSEISNWVGLTVHNSNVGNYRGEATLRGTRGGALNFVSGSTTNWILYGHSGVMGLWDDVGASDIFLLTGGTNQSAFFRCSGTGNIDFSYAGTSRIKSNSTGIGFFNVTPVARQDPSASATYYDDGSASTANLESMINSLYQALINNGLLTGTIGI